MSRIRDIANILTAANDLSTDVETAAAITTAINALPPGYQRGNTASRPASPTVGDIYVNTQTGFVEIYESTGWSQVGAIASTVTGVTATNSPSNRAYNNGSASIAFTPGTFLGKTYTVTSSPGSFTASGSSSPVVVTGLQSSTQYTYTVVASNNYGTASASSASSAVTATTVPQAPSITSVTGGNAQVSVAFSANATGGSSITGYTITSSPGNITANGSSSPIVVTGLTNDTSYTFTATATNANGTSAASSASSSSTPTNTILIDLLMVSGGGGGSNSGGIGSGAGGGSLYYAENIASSGTLNVTVGGGGAVGNSAGSGSPGTFSSVGAISTSVANGAFGGGDTFTGGNSSKVISGTTTNYSGGAQAGTRSNATGSGGGGAGCGAVGGNASASNSGTGGNGLNTYATWATATSSGADSGYYGGGGGGGFEFSGSRSRVAGGLGGGGLGGAGTTAPNYDATNGTANTGGGGGGCGGRAGVIGGASGIGGSGIVIIRTSDTIPTRTTVGAANSNAPYITGGYKYYKFTGTGSITL
jgi:hypothetical protein